MKRFFSFLKQETVLCAAGAAAIASAFVVPPDGAYLHYIDYSTLGILFSLMLVIAGLSSAGVFRALASTLTRRFTSPRKVVLTLVLSCFVLSAFITNDVALITFVPFTISLLGTRDHRRLIWTVIVETVAANLGSLVTPMGNPQNLFLYHFFHYSTLDFLRTMLPLGAVSLACCIALAFAVPRGEAFTQHTDTQAAMNGGPALLWGTAFFLCVACVAGFIPWWLCTVLIFLTALLTGRTLFAKVDYSLLITFALFFIFVGNVARLAPVSQFLRETIRGRELLVGALASQVISNVPAAAMLAPFTENARSLLYGVNIGGLGTLIASMASLISYRRYAAVEGAQRGRYIAAFSCINAGLLIILLAAATLWLK